MNIKKATEKVLNEAGRPLHVKEIAAKVIKSGLWHTTGKTPAATVSAQLSTDVNRKGEKSAFVKVAPNTFGLRANSTVSNVAKSNPLRHKTYSFLKAAEKILEQFADKKPMHYKEITDKAIKQNWLSTSGLTPEATMYAVLITSIKKQRAGGDIGVFYKHSPGYFGLNKWQGMGLSNQIAKHNREVKKKLLASLLELSPAKFEELIGQLLAEMGFESIEVTKYGSDGGIDVRGTMVISAVIRIKMAVQAKRWKNNIQSPTVQQVRGSLGVHEQGLIITTSNFSKGAITEANQPNKTPVALMNGEQLATLLMEYNIGVNRMSHDLFELIS